MSSGKLTVTRGRARSRDLMRAYVVEIDGQKAGQLKSGESATFELAPGNHSVRMTLDRCSSPTLTVSGENDTQLVCDAGSNMFMGLFDMLARPDRYIALERI